MKIDFVYCWIHWIFVLRDGITQDQSNHSFPPVGRGDPKLMTDPECVVDVFVFRADSTNSD